ncbi:MAG: hypothetical protein ACLU8F_00245 [Clostridia bacterium]
MEREVNEEKRKKFMEYAGKRVNNVIHDIQILEPMARSNSYDFTKQDVEEMFLAMQDVLNEAKEEFNKKFEEKVRSSKKVFTFGSSTSTTIQTSVTTSDIEDHIETTE